MIADLDTARRGRLVTTWERLGRPWVPDIKGYEIANLPGWLERHPAAEWAGVEWALAIWLKSKDRGRGTERTWTRSIPFFEEEEAAE